MNNIKRFLQIIGIITLSVFSASAAFAVSGPSGEYSKKGIVWESSISGLIHSPKASDSNKYRIETHWATLFGLGFHGTYMWDCRNIVEELKIETSSDGKYTGLELAEDVLLVVTGTASGTIGGNSGTGVWDSKGVFSTSSQSLRQDVSWCGSVNKDVSYDTNDSATFDGKAMLYIGPRAQEGTIKLSQLSLFKGLERGLKAEIALVSSSTFTIKDKLHCSIMAPPTINFGTVNITSANNGDLLDVKNGDLSVSCTSSYNDNSASSLATINVTGPQGEYPESLKMTMDTGAVAPAEIRGFIGKNISKIGMCNGNTSYPGWINFSDTKQTQNAGILKVGSNNTIPYSFSLCSNGGKARGNATAKAMIELVWE